MDTQKQEVVSTKKKFLDLKTNNLSIALFAISAVILFIYNGSNIVGFLAFVVGWLVAIVLLTKGIKFLLSKTSYNKEEIALNIALVFYMLFFLSLKFL